jgi:G3E family GTPase
MRRRDKFDHLVIETTGIADPAPVIQTFFVDEDMRDLVKLDAVVTVVDVKHVHAHWDSEEVQEQIAFADVILLNKIDLVTPEELDELESRIRLMNKLTKIYRTHNSELDIDAVLGLDAFELTRALEIDPDFLGEDAHQHDETVTSVAIAESGSLNPDRLEEWISFLLQTQGVDIFRMKGILNIAGDNRRYVFQGVHMLFNILPDRAWKKDEVRKNELVFIGRNLNAEQLKKDFLVCVV